MKTLNFRSTLALVVAAAVAGFATAAGASEVRFTFHASDLGDPEALYERMAERAEAACRTNGRMTLSSIKAETACVAGLLGDFVSSAGSPSLTALHERSVSERLAGLR